MIGFYLNDVKICTAVANHTSLLDFIRKDSALCGTKVGCREGDCGACTVLLGYIYEDKLKYESITSCLTPLANVDGKHVVTIEGLNLKDGLNKVQDAMVRHSGTQCGFCTPGFIVSLCGYVLSFEQFKDNHDIISAVDGNICRCTGYKSIQRAACDINCLLEDIPGSYELMWLIENNWVPPYFQDMLSNLKRLESLNNKDINGISVGGGTDLYVQKHDEIHEIEAHYLTVKKDHDPIKIRSNTCTISGVCTVTQLLESTFFRELFSDWPYFMKLVSSTPIRNMATVAGNIINASPIGDLTVIFLALGSNVTFTDRAGIKRLVPLKHLFLSYKVLDKLPEEILIEIDFEIPAPDCKFNFEKVSKRTYLDIASVNTACLIKSANNRITYAHISMGGVGPIPMYLSQVSEYLFGKEINVVTIREAAGYINREIKPISDVRGSKEYKRLLATHLFYCHFVQLFPEQIKMELLV